MVHNNCDWAIAGECDFCGHRTNPDNMLTCYKHSFCDEECMREWKAQEDKKKDIQEPLERRAKMFCGTMGISCSPKKKKENHNTPLTRCPKI